MTYETIYEISKFPLIEMIESSGLFFSLVGIAVIILFIREKINGVKKNKKTLNTAEIIAIFILAIILTVIIFTLPGAIKDEFQNEALVSSEKYYAGEYDIAEGKIIINEDANWGICAFDIEDNSFTIVQFGGISKYVLRDKFAKIYFVRDAYDDTERIVRIDILKE